MTIPTATYYIEAAKQYAFGLNVNADHNLVCECLTEILEYDVDKYGESIYAALHVYLNQVKGA